MSFCLHTYITDPKESHVIAGLNTFILGVRIFLYGKLNKRTFTQVIVPYDTLTEYNMIASVNNIDMKPTIPVDIVGGGVPYQLLSIM